MVSGASHSIGTDATFWVRWLVTARSIAEPVAERPSHVRIGIFPSGCPPGASEGVSEEEEAREASGGVSQATAAHRTAKPANSSDHPTTCSRAVNTGSTTNG